MINTPISVVMATYNGVHFLQEQIESILQQSMPPFEIIICDDGSIDGTIEILKDYAAKGLIQYYANDKRLGVVANFKKGVKQACDGNYIALCDQDDIWMPHKLETLQNAINKLEQNTIGINTPCIAYSDIVLIDEQKNVLNHSFWNELNHDVHEHCLKTLLFGNFVTGCSIMFNQSTKIHFKNIPELILHDVWLAFVGNTIGKIKAIDEPLLLYRQHEHNVNYNKGKRKDLKWQARFKRLKKLFTKNTYLTEEYFIAKSFLHSYQEQLTNKDKNVIKLFLITQHLPYLFKEIALKIFFWGKWK